MRTPDDLRALRQELCDVHTDLLFNLIERYRKAYRLVGYVEGGYHFYTVGNPQPEDSGNPDEKLSTLRNAVKVAEDNLAMVSASRKRMLDAIRDGLALDEEYGADLRNSLTETKQSKVALHTATDELKAHISQVAAEALVKKNMKPDVLDEKGGVSSVVMFPIFDYDCRGQTRTPLREIYKQGIKKGDGKLLFDAFNAAERLKQERGFTAEPDPRWSDLDLCTFRLDRGACLTVYCSELRDSHIKINATRHGEDLSDVDLAEITEFIQNDLALDVTCGQYTVDVNETYRDVTGFHLVLSRCNYPSGTTFVNMELPNGTQISKGQIPERVKAKPISSSTLKFYWPAFPPVPPKPPGKPRKPRAAKPPKDLDKNIRSMVI